VRDLCRPQALLDAVAVRAYRQLVGLLIACVAGASVYAAAAFSGIYTHAQTSGVLREAGLDAPVTIARDARGVPHITAATQHDLFFAQGFAEGSDRLFQMELTRRYALGTLAEVFGPRALGMDESNRYYDVRDIVRRQWRALAPSDRAALTSFSAGVNAAMRRQPLPVEFRLLLYRPEPWAPQDSLAVSAAVSIALADSWHDLLRRNDVWQRYGPQEFERYFPLSDSGYDVTLRGAPVRPRENVAVAARGRLPKTAAFARTALQPRPAPKVGSNAWAAGGAVSTSGHALLANDPHLDLTIPGLWYLADLRAPGLHVAGASIPGAPGILLGHNERIAWGATNADAVAMSAFAAGKLSPSGWKRERFRVRFSKDVARAYYRTSREFAVPNPDARNPLALVRWVPYSSGASSIATFLALDRAGSIGEALTVLSRYRGTSENFIVAGSNGAIAYHLAGNVPLDPSWGRYVHPAAELGRTFAPIPFDRLPAIAPSRDALLISANNKMYRPGYPYRLSATFEPPYRAYRIAALLHQRLRYDAAWFARMQLDTVSPIDAEFARIVAARAPDYRGDLRTERAARGLSEWNGSFAASSRAATIEHAVRARLELDAPSLNELVEQLRSGTAGPSIEADLQDALAYASGLAQPWGRAGAVTIEHPLAPLRFGFLNGATLPGDGDEYTIHLQEDGFSQSFRAVWEVGNWDAGGIVIPSGESGEPGSGHYDDLSASWIAGRMVALPFSAAAVRAATRERLELRP
jgi:penicillin amidase